MARMSPDSLEYFAVEPRAITRRYENRESPVMTSSDNPSARLFRSALLPVNLNGRTATQNPSSDLLSPEEVGDAVALSGAGFESPSAIGSPAFRSPSTK